VKPFASFSFTGKHALDVRAMNGPASAMQLLNASLPPGMRPIMKTRSAFFLKANGMTKLARYFCKDLIRPRRLARTPSRHVSLTALRTALLSRLTSKSVQDVNLALRPLAKLRRPTLNVISLGLGQTETRVPNILRANVKVEADCGQVVAFPKPEKRKDGSLIYDEVLSRTSRPATPQQPSSSAADLSRGSRGNKRKAGAGGHDHHLGDSSEPSPKKIAISPQQSMMKPLASSHSTSAPIPSVSELVNEHSSDSTPSDLWVKCVRCRRVHRLWMYLGQGALHW
jgi:hypothetical protein